MNLIPRFRFTQKTLDTIFDFTILITSVITLVFVFVSIIPMIILLPEYWLRPFIELILLGYLGIRGVLLWKKEVR